MYNWFKKKQIVDKVFNLNISRRSEYRICLEMEKANPRNCPVNIRAGDGVYVGACWHYLPDGKTCPSHGVVK